MDITTVPPLGGGLKIMPLGAKAPRGIIFQPPPSGWNCVYVPKTRDITYNTRGRNISRGMSTFPLF